MFMLFNTIQFLNNLIALKKSMQSQSLYILQQWYLTLQHCTASSIFIPISNEEIKFIMITFDTIYAAYFRELNYSKKKKEGDESFIYEKGSWLANGGIVGELRENQVLEARDQLLQKIRKQMKENTPYFAKLSLRSPKDSLALRKYKSKLQQTYSESQLQTLGSELDRLSLQVHTPDQVLQVLCSSQRIKDDLKRLQTKTDKYQPNIILREWQTIPSCLEFRVFMCGRKLTAVCSYYKSQRNQWMMAYRELIKNAINSFFEEKIKQKVPYENAVFDIGFELPYQETYTHSQIQQRLKTNQFKPTLIEINPFSKATGAALYNWQEDKTVLHNGPLEIRLSGQEDFI